MSESALGRLSLAICVVATVLTGITGALFFLDREAADFLLQENGPYEQIGAASCLLAALLFGWTFLRGRRRANPWIALLSGAFLLLFLEEISWGQHIFGFSTPKVLLRTNIQEETNVHNLVGIHYVAHAAGIVILQIYFAILPIATVVSNDVRILVERMAVPVPPLAIALIFTWTFLLVRLPYTLLYGHSTLLYAQSVGFSMNYGEMQEFIYQFGALVYAYFLARSDAANRGSAPRA